MGKFIHSLLSARTDHPAVSDGTISWTYRQLDEVSRRVARGLLEQGIHPGDRLMVTAVSTLPFTAIVFAASHAGITLVPLHPETTDREKIQIRADCGARTVLDANALAVLTETSIAFRDESGRDGTVAPAFLLYTSGTTGTPKGVIAAHHRVLYAVEAIQHELGYGESDEIFCHLPLSFDYGLYQLLLAARVGAHVILDDWANGMGTVQRIRHVSPSIVPVVPSLVGLWSRRSRGDVVADSVRLVTSTGEALTPDMAEQLHHMFPRAEVRAMYGATECKRISIAPARPPHTAVGTVGRPLPGTTVSIRDVVGDVVGAGTVGEIYVEGEHVMDGYWGQPELTATVFLTDPLTCARRLRTHDRGYLDEEGFLYVLGRDDGVFKLNGVRTSAAELEAAARAVSGVEEAVVVDAARMGPTIFFVGDAAPEDLLRKLRVRVNLLKVPRRAVRIGELPRTRNGKIDRVTLGGSVYEEQCHDGY